MAFLGIQINHETGRLLSKIDVPGEKVDSAEMHITLLHFGKNWELSKLTKSIQPIYDVISDIKPFIIKFNKVSCFPKNDKNISPIIVPIKSNELQEMRSHLAKKFDKAKIDFSKDFDYNPHITLSYHNEELDKDLKLEFPIEFVVSELILWGGDCGDEKIFVTFPLDLSKQNKNAALLQKINVFEKVAK